VAARRTDVKSEAAQILNSGLLYDDIHREMSDPRVAKIAALYRAGTATDGRSETPRGSVSQDEQRARAWKAELARSMAQLARRQQTS
jgi:hypothetical protein